VLLGCRCSSGHPPGRFQLRTADEMASRGYLRATNWTCFPRAVRPGWRPRIMHGNYARCHYGSSSSSPRSCTRGWTACLDSMSMGCVALMREPSTSTTMDTKCGVSTVHNCTGKRTRV
jgi:hypothetical protein